MRRQVLLLLVVAMAGMGLALWALRGSARRYEAAAPASPASTPSSAPVVLVGGPAAPPSAELAPRNAEAVDGKASRSTASAAAASATTGHVEVLVLSAQTGHPVGGQRLFALPAEPGLERSFALVEASTGDLEHAPRTAPDGRAAFVLAPGPYRIACPRRSRPDPGEGELVLGLEAGERRELTFRIATEEFAFVGRVVDELTREPIGGATLALDLRFAVADPDGGVRILQAQWSALRSDERGFFRGRVLPAPELVALVAAPGYLPEAVAIEPGHETDASAALVLLKPLARLRVELHEAGGLALPHHEVQLLAEGSGGIDPPIAARAHTDAQGIAWLEGLPPGQPLLPAVVIPRMEGADDSLAGFAPALVLEAGEERREIWTTAGSAIRGRVLDQADEPVPDQRVWIGQAPREEPAGSARDIVFGGVFETARSDASGEFWFAALAPGSYRVGLDAGELLDPTPAPVRVEILGREGIEGIVLRSPRDASSIRGRAEDE